MTGPRAKVTADYLNQLALALTDVDATLKDEIVAGVAEELVGLDDVTARERIAQLGPPSAIAFEAARAGGESERTRGRPWFTILSALFYGYGWIVVPGVGWVLGLIAVGLSPTWSTTQKWRAALIPVASGLITAGILVTLLLLTETPSSSLTTWNVIVIGGLTGGTTSIILGTRMCARFVRAQRAVDAEA